MVSNALHLADTFDEYVRFERDAPNTDGEDFGCASFGAGEIALLPLVDVALSVDELYFDPENGLA